MTDDAKDDVEEPEWQTGFPLNKIVFWTIYGALLVSEATPGRARRIASKRCSISREKDAFNLQLTTFNTNEFDFLPIHHRSVNSMLQCKSFFESIPEGHDDLFVDSELRQ